MLPPAKEKRLYLFRNDNRHAVLHDLKFVLVQCGNTVLSGIVDTGPQISVVRERLVIDLPCKERAK